MLDIQLAHQKMPIKTKAVSATTTTPEVSTIEEKRMIRMSYPKSMLALALLLLISLYSCHNKSEIEITNTINAVYKTPNVYEYLGADTALLSKQLSELVANAKEVEELDRLRVSNSEYPTDKPLLIEGEIYTSIYEGFTSFKIDEIKIEGDKALAIVDFKNDGYNLSWGDTLLLINQNGWKLEDVKYQKGKGTLQQTLKDFIVSFKD